MKNWAITCQRKILSIPHLRAAVLISSKEAYLFLKNLYGLLTHPFKTIVQIRKKPDRSQTILVLGLPVWVGLGFLGIVGLVGIGFWYFRPTSQILVRVVLVGLGLGLLGTLGVLGYVGYWVGRYWGATPKR